MNKHGFIVKFKTQVGKREELLEILSVAAASMKNVKGCNLYLVYKDAADETMVWVSELWDSEADQMASLQDPAARELIGKAMPLLDGKPEAHKLVAI